jgi:hypothetical protein
MAGQYKDDGDPNKVGGGQHVFIGSICKTDPTTPNSNRQPTPHALCEDGYEEGTKSQHDYVCDHTGHWVVGTTGKGSRNPYIPPDGPGGQGLVCLGQVCPDNGQTPHDGDCGGHCTKGPAEKEWPYTNYEPCYTQESVSSDPSNPTTKKLHYSDTCNSKDPKEWGDDCHCTSECVTGYTADGTVDGIAERTFRCLQDNNEPYFGTSESTAHGGPHAQPQVCKAVTCRDVMDPNNHKNGHMPVGEGDDPKEQHRLVPTNTPVTKPDAATPRCGASDSKNLAKDDKPGHMRYDRGGDHWKPAEKPKCDPEHSPALCRNKCFASCAKGYTADESSQTQQIFTCNSDGTYSGSLTCDKISCQDGRTYDGKPNSKNSRELVLSKVLHANRSEDACPSPSGNGSSSETESPYGRFLKCANPNWLACKDPKSSNFNDKCQLECEAGFTRSSQDPAMGPVTDQRKVKPVPVETRKVKPYECQAREDGRFPENGDTKYQKFGTWTGNLKCEAVTCGNLPRPVNTKGGKNTYGGDPPEPHQGYLPDNRLCISAGHGGPETAPEGNHTEGDARYFGDQCTIECLKSWYPVHSNRKIVYTCTEPDSNWVGNQSEGVWCPGERCWKTQRDHLTPNVYGEELECIQGSLSAKRSNLYRSEYADKSSFASIKVDTLPWPTKGADPKIEPKSITAFGGPGTNAPTTDGAKQSNGFLGYRFGRGKGPVVEFKIQAADQHGNPRSYHNLNVVKSAPEPDYVVMIIERVKVQRIADTDACDPNKPKDPDTCDKHLQPQLKYMPKSLPAEAVMTHGKYEQDRPYQEGQSVVDVKEFNNDLTTKMSLANDEDKDNGIFTLTHQFTEHGVFFITAFMCPYDDKSCCISKADGGYRDDDEFKEICKHAIVPGTGLWQDVSCNTTNCCSEEPYKYEDACCALEDAPCPLNNNDLPPSTFTICPQNTDTRDEGINLHGVVKGSGLWLCKPKVGFFSPEGAGRVAEKCNDENDYKGYTCPFPGMTWPVARPGFWVSPYDPTRAVKCTNLGACPGGKQFGVGSPRWQKCGSKDGVKCAKGVPTESCLVDGNYYTPDFCDKVDCDKRIVRNDCFWTTKYIQRGEDDLNYRLQAGGADENGTKLDCFDQVGSRCCPGSHGDGCLSCCASDTLPSRNPSCNRTQWHVISVGEGGHCEMCPKSQPGPMFLMALLVFLLLGPVVAKVGDLAQHAGAAQGPMLSVVNFFQSSDLFMGLKQLKWPPEFKAFAREIASMFNFNISALLKKLMPVELIQWFKHLHIHLAIPYPQCALHLPYEQKWLLSMATPFILFAALMLLIPLAALLRPIRKRMPSCPSCGACCRGICSCCARRKRERLQGNMPLIATPEVPVERRPKWLTEMHIDFQNELFQLLWDEVKERGTICQSLRQDVQQQFELDEAQVDEAVQFACVARPQGSESGLAFAVPRRHGLIAEYVRMFKRLPQHDIYASLRSTARPVLFYLMVGYVFLASTALEPLSCETQLDGLEYMTASAALDYKCETCENDQDDQLVLTYRQLKSLAVVFYTLYGFGTPMLFLFILYQAHKEHRLHTHEFTEGFGFLSSKMTEDKYWWEVCISFRKLLLVTVTKTSSGRDLPFTLINLFIIMMAFGAQVWTTPFSTADANVAESLMLLCIILILILGLAGGIKTNDSAVDTDQAAVDALNIAIYILIGFCIVISLYILLRRLGGAWFALRNRAAFDKYRDMVPSTLPDHVREMLHKRKIKIAEAWLSLKDNGPGPGTGHSSAPLEFRRKLAEVFESAKLYKDRTELTKQLKNWQAFFPKDFRPLMYAWAMRESDDPDEQEQFDNENNQLNEIMRRMERMEQEQHRVLPACIQCCYCCALDVDDEDEEGIDWDERDRLTVSGGAPANASRLRAASEEQKRTGNASVRLAQRGRMSRKRPQSSPGISREPMELSLRQSFGTGTVSGGVEDVRQSVLFRRRQQQEDREQQSQKLLMRLPKLRKKMLAFIYSSMLSTTLRTLGTFLLIVFTWGFTVCCVVQYQMESAESQRYQDYQQKTSMKLHPKPRDKGCKAREPGVWMVYLALYYVFWLVVVPFTTTLQQYGYIARWQEWVKDRCRCQRAADTFGGAE